MPAEGAADLAIKIYLGIHMRDLTRCDDAAALSANVFEDLFVEGHDDARLEMAIFKDAVRFVPELAPLAARAIARAEEVAEEIADAEKDFGRALTPSQRRLVRTFIKVRESRERRRI